VSRCRGWVRQAVAGGYETSRGGMCETSRGGMCETCRCRRL